MTSDDRWSVLWGLADRLRHLGYTEQAVSESMGVNDHARRDHLGWPAHIRNCRSIASPCATLSAFFLIEGLMGEAQILPLLGSEILSLMREMGWVTELDGKLHFRYLLYPLLGNFILTDGFSSNPPGNLDQVYQLGADSHQFARLNAGLNRRDNMDFIESDCYRGLEEREDTRSFDLVTANPPFVPTPETLSLYRGGGIGGEEVTEKIVRGLPRHLSPNGIFAMITNIPIRRDQTFFARCQEWLGFQESWAMIVISDHIWSLESYVIGHQSPTTPQDYGKNFQTWLDAYATVDLQAVSNSQVYLFRSPRAWRLERFHSFPKEPVPEFIEGWISSLRSYGARRPVRYQIHPGIQKISWLDDHTKAYLEWKPEFHWWESRGVWLEGAAVSALDRIQSEAIVDDWGQDEGLAALLAQNLLATVD